MLPLSYQKYRLRYSICDASVYSSSLSLELRGLKSYQPVLPLKLVDVGNDSTWNPSTTEGCEARWHCGLWVEVKV